MVVYLWNWYPVIDESGRVSVNGFRRGAMRKESVKRFLGIFEQGLLLETMEGHRIALEYIGALDARIPSYAAINYPESGQSTDLKLEAAYRGGRLRPDSPLLFYLLCRMAWKPGRSNAYLQLMRRSHYLAVSGLMRARKELRLRELRKPKTLLNIMRKQEMFLELGSGEPFFMRRAYWRDASGTVSDETKSIRIGGGNSHALIYCSKRNHESGDPETGDLDRENRLPHLYFTYCCSSEPYNLLDLAGLWTRCVPGFLRVGNVGKEPLCLFGKAEAPGYVIMPGRQFAVDREELKFCETRPWETLNGIPWLRPDFSLGRTPS